MTYECDKCEHYRVIDDHGDKTMECLITKCPLVLRDEVIEKAAKVAESMKVSIQTRGAKVAGGVAGFIASRIATSIRAMKGQRK